MRQIHIHTQLLEIKPQKCSKKQKQKELCHVNEILLLICLVMAELSLIETHHEEDFR